MKRILVVDDDPSIVESLKFVFEDAGFIVDSGEDGSFIQKNFYHARPDLILLDYWLTGDNGGKITRKLKKRKETKDIPVVIMSASYNIKELVDQAGADDFLSKPYDIDELIRTVKKHLK